MTGNNSVDASTDYEQGTIDFWNDTAGYGFIASDAFEDDVFFFVDEVGVPESAVEEGKEVEFVAEETEKGPRAVEMRFPLTDGGRDDFDDRLIVSQVSEEDGVYRVTNYSHDDPSEHEYLVFVDDSEAYHCECPAWEHHEGTCKHMRAVESKIESRQEWRDWQNVQAEREEAEREQTMEETTEAYNDLTPSEWRAIATEVWGVDAVAYPDNECDEEAVEETEQDDDDEESIGSQMAKELLEGDHDLPSESEWRKMSSDARAKTVAFL